MFDLELDAQTHNLDAIARRARNIKPGLRNVADDMRGQFAEVFRRQGVRGRWKPLDDLYATTRDSRPLGVQSGEMRRSFTNRGAKGSVQKVRADTLEVGSDLVQAIYFQKGRPSQPKRNLVPDRRQVRRRASQVLAGYLIDGRRSSGGIFR